MRASAARWAMMSTDEMSPRCLAMTPVSWCRTPGPESARTITPNFSTRHPNSAAQGRRLTCGPVRAGASEVALPERAAGFYLMHCMTDLLARLQAALGDRYQIGREFGGGGMSRVFVAEERGLGRQVVVKVLPPELGAAVSAERFRQEIRLAASLQHPHVVPVLTAGEGGGLLYYTMPLIEGETLRSRLARVGPLPVPEAVRIHRDVLDALAYAHRHHIVHRDIKPENVLLNDQHALVTDFGVAKALTQATGGGS